METNEDILAARAKLAAKFTVGSRTGGKGTVRRKVKAKSATTVTDDKKLQAQMKKLGCNTIPGIEEVNMFTDDGKVIHFDQPKLQASLSANTYVVTGASEKKNLQELLPNIITQLGNDNLMSLKKIAESLQETGGAAAGAGKEVAKDDDDDIPDIDDDVNFEDVSKA